MRTKPRYNTLINLKTAAYERSVDRGRIRTYMVKALASCLTFHLRPPS